MPLTREELEKEKEELIKKLLKFDDYLHTRMESGKFYTEGEFSSFVRDYAIQEYGTDKRYGLDKKGFMDGLTPEGMKIYQRLGEFIARLQFIGSIGKRTTSEGDVYFRQNPPLERVSFALKFIRTRL